MSQRLLEVPNEEDHLHSVGSVNEDENESPLMKKEKLQQIVETNRGDFLNSEQSENKNNDDSDTDEEDYMKQ